MKIFIFLILCLLNVHDLFCQISEEEYLYLKLGYKEQLLKGLDDKKGYSWKTITQYSFYPEKGSVVPFSKGKSHTKSVIDFEGLFREGEPTACAIVAIYREDEQMKKRDGIFVPIPHHKSDKEIIRKAETYFEEEIKFDAKLMLKYSLALSKLSTTLTQGQGAIH